MKLPDRLNRSLILLFLISSHPPAFGQNGLDIEALAKQMVETRTFEEVALSPNGRTIAYVLHTSSVEANENMLELCIQKLDQTGAPQGEPASLEKRVSSDQYAASFGVKWWPDGSSIVYSTAKHGLPSIERLSNVASSELVRYDLGSGTFSRIPLLDDLSSEGSTSQEDRRPKITQIGRDYQWSPKGRFIAFTAPIQPIRKLDSRKGLSETPDLLLVQPSARTGLFVLDVGTGVLEQVTPNTLDVNSFKGFAWAPDERSLVVSAKTNPGRARRQWTDLYIVERGTRAARPLVVQSGWDDGPSWSPDGKWIAFGSQYGSIDNPEHLPALVSTKDGKIIRLARDGDPTTHPIDDLRAWTEDSRGFYYTTEYHLNQTLAYADIRRKTVAQMFSDESYNDRSHSFAADRKRVAFVRQSSIDPPEIYVQELPDGIPKPVTRLNEGFPLTKLVRVDRVSWPARDGKPTLHGLLLTPRSAWNDNGKSVKKTLVTVVYIPGGPHQVGNRSFGRGGYYQANIPLVARGYAVFIPNTRLQEHGYDFASGYGHSGRKVPSEDILTGIDRLVEMGITDRERVGIRGHSAGAMLATYAITHPGRFMAAVLHDASEFDELVWGVGRVQMPDSVGEVIHRKRYGVAHHLDPSIAAKVIEETPLFHFSKVTTPTMLQFGNKSPKLSSGVAVYTAFQRLKVPVEFLIYDENHISLRPAAVADEIVRAVQWFDYWLRDMPYPDNEREKEFNAWKAKRSAEKQNTEGTATNKPKTVNNAKRP